jgi:hypothetical protein
LIRDDLCPLELGAAGGSAGPGVAVLDLCCGVAGPGRMITAESGCRDRQLAAGQLVYIAHQLDFAAGSPDRTHGAAQSIRGAEVRRAGVPVRFGGAFKTPR